MISEIEYINHIIGSLNDFREKTQIFLHLNAYIVGIFNLIIIINNL